jgi:hypothetical protein
MGDGLRNAAQQEVVDAPFSVRTDRYEIGMPFGCSAENCPNYVSDQNLGLSSKSRSTQFARNLLNQ